MTSLLTIIAAALLGSMLFFPVVVAPMVFRVLPAEQAGRFLRCMFPRYYLWGLAMSALGLAAAINLQITAFLLLSLVLIGFVLSREILMPGINEARDLAVQTRDPAHGRRFRRLHGISVVINVVQIVLLAILLVRLGLQS